MQTEEPYWLEEAYSRPINISDTGYMQRNLNLSRQLTTLFSLFFNVQGKYLDYAGGYGVFVRLMRDVGFDYYWDDKYSQNLFSEGFEWDQSKPNSIEAITTFESFEHFVNPMEEIDKILSISNNLIFTTLLLPDPIPTPDNWWYYGLDHGQHISFYTEKTLRYIANHFELHYFNTGYFFMLTSKDNISKHKLKLLKLGNYGLNTFMQKRLKSKVWDDYLLMSKITNACLTD
ncbi:class I SAM-dependent methyltransferase [Deltaproteobacteria bacterium TL4]